MTCARPVVFRPKGAYLPVRIPCGHCMPCRIARSREWCTRMYCELEQWRSSSFVTLTYDDEHLPEGANLLPYDLELWLKRLRRALEPRRIRFYAAGEYGSETLRPHYHAIVFGADPVSDAPAIDDAWGLGWSKVGTVTEHSIRYVADYVISKLNGEEAAKVYQGRRPPFARMSQGIGRDWCDARADELRVAMAITHRGHEVLLPRYFARRLGLTSADTLAARALHGREVSEKHSDDAAANIETRIGYGPSWWEWPSVRASNAQNELDARAKLGLRPRGKL